jgi:lipid II:glycine glycyltransferase (peptidoglycan interpeptide bridge formation enzyme)
MSEQEEILDDLNLVVEKYLKKCFKELETWEQYKNVRPDTSSEDKIDDWIYDVFIQQATNDWETGEDICDYYKISDYAKTVPVVLGVIKYCDKCYRDNFGTTYLEYDKLEPDYLLRHYAYCYANDLGCDAIKKLLRLKANDTVFKKGVARKPTGKFYEELTAMVEKGENLVSP